MGTTLVAPASLAISTMRSTCSGASFTPGISGATRTPVGMPARLSSATASSRARGFGVCGSLARHAFSSSVGIDRFAANLSIPTMDEKPWRASEPHTPNPKARMEAVAELNRAGIPTGILIAPLMPGIDDAPEQVEEIIALATEAGAAHIGGITLHLRGEVRGIFMEWLRSYRPDLVERYEALYARGAYAPRG